MIWTGIASGEQEMNFDSRLRVVDIHVPWFSHSQCTQNSHGIYIMVCGVGGRKKKTYLVASAPLKPFRPIPEVSIPFWNELSPMQRSAWSQFTIVQDVHSGDQTRPWNPTAPSRTRPHAILTYRAVVLMTSPLPCLCANLPFEACTLDLGLFGVTPTCHVGWRLHIGQVPPGSLK